MLPTLRPGRLVVARRKYSNLAPNDVVIIRHGGLEKIKRISALRGDQVYLVGDNREHSTDSRIFGWLHVSAILAKVVWPG